MTSDDDHGASGARPRVLIPITISFAVRYVVRTGLLARIGDACHPVLALSWDDEALAGELAAQGIEVVRLPDARVDAATLGLFGQLEVHFIRRLRSPSSRIDRSRRHAGRPRSVRLRRWASWQRQRLRSLAPGHEAAVAAVLQAALPARTNLTENQQFLRTHRIDAVFSVTPFTAQERVVLLAAAESGLPRCTSILSFDNITTRPPLPVPFQRYLVWNRFNREEILRSHRDVTADQVRIVGPAQFDFYLDPSHLEDRAAWRARKDLGDHPTILFGAGPPEVAPHEPQYVQHLCEAIDTGDLPPDARILLRRHPIDRPERWEQFRRHPAVVLDDPGRVGDTPGRPGQVDLGQDQITDLCSALAHTDVHVSVSSTMTLDGAFFGKPQIGPAYDTTPGHPYRRLASELYDREHFVPIVASGGLELARSRRELVAAVRRGFDEPERLATERRAMLEALCTYTDGGCTERVADEVRSFLMTFAR